MYVILIILVLLLPIPLYVAFQSLFIRQRHRKSMLAIEDAYKRVVERNNLRILELSRFINRLIAIDRSNRKLVLLVYKDGVTWEKCIALEEIISCQITKAVDNESYIQSVSIQLILHNNNETISFSFFDNRFDDERDLSQRTKRADYWQKKILYFINVPLTGYRLNHLVS